MQAVDQNNFFFTQLHRGVVRDALASSEIVIRNANLAPGEKVTQILVYQLHVESLGGLKVIVAKFILGMHFKVVKVVIDVQGNQFKAKLRQVLTYLDGRGGLSARGGTSHKDHANFIPPVEDHVGGVFNVFMIGSFSRGDNFVQAVMPNGFIQKGSCLDVVRASPVQRLPEFWPGDVSGWHAVAIGAFFPLAGSFLAIEDVCLGDLGAAVLNQHLLDEVLDVFDVWDFAFRCCFLQLGNHLRGERL